MTNFPHHSNQHSTFWDLRGKLELTQCLTDHKYARDFYTKLGPAMNTTCPFDEPPPNPYPPEFVSMRMLPLWIPSPYPGGDPNFDIPPSQISFQNPVLTLG